MIGLIHRVAGNAGERRLVAKCGMEGTFVWFGQVVQGRLRDKCVEMPQQEGGSQGQEENQGSFATGAAASENQNSHSKGRNYSLC